MFTMKKGKKVLLQNQIMQVNFPTTEVGLSGSSSSIPPPLSQTLANAWWVCCTKHAAHHKGT